ncbi:ARF GTPase-activating protein Git isoform X2 [Onthophagus taurus]|uniref:ARF GTPase-activating protein Git isoform X2 n=1 Tax=Onthophagus taurus TaxID=166361 RepID=UPI0039BDDF33
MKNLEKFRLSCWQECPEDVNEPVVDRTTSKMAIGERMSSRAKSRPTNTDVCADCGANDPTWASVNRGILLCVECCCIHRNLGRHISQVKSLHQSTWNGNLLTMVQTLNNSGVNNMWEHTLLENGSKLNKKKPNPRDPLDTKAVFINEKHEQCLFVFRPNNEDGLLCVENELGKQLHASVRTNNLDTSFRLLIQGADPNFFHDEKGTTPLHVAAKKNQVLQAELLVVYGADPTYPDLHGKTPIDYAKQKGHKDLMIRLMEMQYEVTDKLSVYLCQRKPDHQNGVHFLIPNNGPKSDQIINNKLKKLPNRLFEELVADVYDEIDRREIEAIWLSSSDSVKLNATPFLPVDKTLSRTRNQSRQKLGKFLSPELRALVYDILVDTQRRIIASERGINLPKLREVSQLTDDDPLYDSVASDDDYAIVADNEDKNDIDGKNLIRKDDNDNMFCLKEEKVEVVELTKKLEMSDTKISTLQQEVVNLKAVIEKLNSENTELRTRLSHAETNSLHSFNGIDSGCSSLDGFLSESKFVNGQIPASPVDLRNRRQIRPLSMYETREGLKTPNWQNIKNQLKHNTENQMRTTTSLYNTNSYGNPILYCTEQITKAIQQLMQSAQDTNARDQCLTQSEKIKVAVLALVANIPVENKTEATRNLLDNVYRLQSACSNFVKANKTGDQQQSQLCFQGIREWAYEIAKETKQIVTKYNSG